MRFTEKVFKHSEINKIIENKILQRKGEKGNLRAKQSRVCNLCQQEKVFRVYRKLQKFYPK